MNADGSETPPAVPARRATLLRLADEVRALCAALNSLRAQLLNLIAAERDRPLTSREVQHARQLVQEYERLCEALSALRAQFE